MFVKVWADEVLREWNYPENFSNYTSSARRLSATPESMSKAVYCLVFGNSVNRSSNSSGGRLQTVWFCGSFKGVLYPKGPQSSCL
jgi:hypothetical protein